MKPEHSSEEGIKRLKDGFLPLGVRIREDPETGRKYFNYVFRLSTDVEWRKIGSAVEAVSNVVVTHCDFVPEGIYEADGITAIVILKRNTISGISWEEIEFYGKGATPEQISNAYDRFRKGDFKPVTRWSGGIPSPAQSAAA